MHLHFKQLYLLLLRHCLLSTFHEITNAWVRTKPFVTNVHPYYVIDGPGFWQEDKKQYLNCIYTTLLVDFSDITFLPFIFRSNILEQHLHPEIPCNY